MTDSETLARLTSAQQRQINNTIASLRKWIASERAKGTPEAAIKSAMQDCLSDFLQKSEITPCAVGPLALY